MRKLGIAFVVLVALIAVGVAERHRLIAFSLSLAGAPPLGEREDEGPGVRWFDDYYTVQALDARTWAIGEPRFFQQNFNYLIAGSERAVLFDAGTGEWDEAELSAWRAARADDGISLPKPFGFRSGAIFSFSEGPGWSLGVCKGHGDSFRPREVQVGKSLGFFVERSSTCCNTVVGTTV